MREREQLQNGVMLALGDFMFSVSGTQYQELKTSMSWRWASRDRLNRKPAKQFLGAASDSKTLSIAVYPQNKNDLYTFERLQTLANKGRPLRLVGGTPSGGADLGLWIIEKLDKGEKHFTDNGLPLSITGSLTISEYGEDK